MFQKLKKELGIERNDSFHEEIRISDIFWIKDKEKHKKEFEKTNGQCCFNHQIGLPISKIPPHREMPIFGYEMDIIESIERYWYYALNKARGIGATELILRWVLFRAIHNKISRRKFLIVTAIGIHLANEHIKRISEMCRKIPHVKAKSQEKIIVSDLNEIRDLSSIVFYSLLMLAREKEGNVTKFLHLLRICVSLFVRYKTIVGLHYTKLEKLTIAACELIRNNESITSSRIKQLFKDIYPNDVIFESAFRVHSQNDNKIARYLLVKICRMYEYDTAPEDTITLEHVIPEAMRKYRGVVYGNKPDNIKEWDKYMRTHGLNYTEIYRLGNMALLLPKDNEQVKDKTFKEKKKIYKRSSISFTKNISKFSKWDLSTISKRQDELAKKAKTIWKINF